MAIIVNGVSADVVALREGADQGGYVASVTYQVAWSQRGLFVVGLAGEVVTYGTPGGGTIERRVAHAYPDNAQLDIELHADTTGISIEPVGPLLERADGWLKVGREGGDSGNGEARITVPYRVLPYDPGDDSPYFVEQLRGSAQLLKIPGAGLTFENDSKPVGDDAGILVPEIEVLRTYYRLPYVPTAIWDLMGKVNASAFELKGSSRPVGTVMLMQPESTEARGLGGTENTLSLSFLWRPVDWRKALSKYTGTWQFIKKPDTNYIYETGDFSLLDF